MTQSRSYAVSLQDAGSTGRTGVVLFAMCLGVFIAQVDSTVVYLAVSSIGADLDAGIVQQQWILDIYNLIYAALLLTGGTLADILGRARMFVFGIGLIAAGSIVCAVAPGTEILIAGRAVTGLGAALEIPASLAILTVAYPDPHARGRAIGIWASCNGIAIAVGPSVGGILVQTLGWRSIFYAALPICAIAMWLAWARVPNSRDAGERKLDPLGQALAIVTLGSLAFVTIEGPHRGWTSPLIVAPAITMIVAALIFVQVERNQTTALVPFELFANRAFNAALGLAGLMTFGMYGMLFLVPIYLQSFVGLKATEAGFALVPLSLVFVAVSQVSGSLTKRFGARAMTAGGMGAMGAGLVVLVATVGSGNLAATEAGLIVTGLGLGLNTGPVNAVAVANVASARSGTASGLLNTARMIGATLGIALLGALYALQAGDGTAEGLVNGLRVALGAGAIAELSGVAIALRYLTARSAEQKQA
jgi:DHA2 family methylenomycin A resistance protein-like MFS transporter